MKEKVTVASYELDGFVRLHPFGRAHQYFAIPHF